MKKLVLFFVSLFLVFSGYAITRYVPSGGSPAYSSIQAAINASNPGDLILVKAGNYIQSLTVNVANLTIQGAGPTKTFIKTLLNVPAITLSANGFILKNLAITNNTYMKYGIKVIPPASVGLTVDGVYFTNMNPYGLDIGYGIEITTSMANVVVQNCEFTALLVASRVIAIYGGGETQTNWLVQNNTKFANLYAGIYLNASVSGLTVQGNTFGPWDLADCQQAASGLYIGDGNANFDINNVTVTGNTFTSYARGVYFLNNSANRTIGNTLISGNIFTNSIWSSGIRIVAGTQLFETYAPSKLEGPVTVSNNIFTQSATIVNGSGVSMIDLRTVTGGESNTSLVSVTGNSITFTGTFNVPIWGVLLRGPITHADILGNTFSGTTSGSGGLNMPPTTAVCLQTDYLDYGPMASDAVFNIKNNSISGFIYGIAAFNMLTKVYGGIPFGAAVDVTSNTISNNTFGIYSGIGKRINAVNNWWGTNTGPYHSTNMTGTGNPVTDFVDFLPFYLAVPNATATGTVNSAETVCYNAAEVITVAGLPNIFLVKTGGSATLIAGQKISFLPGTAVQPGGYMRGYIAPNGPFCSPSSVATSPTGIDELAFSSNEDVQFKAYPNPTDGNFTLVQRGDKFFENVTMTLYSMHGERIITRELSGQKSFTFSVSGYPSGFYFIKLVANDHVESIKLIKTN